MIRNLSIRSCLAMTLVLTVWSPLQSQTAESTKAKKVESKKTQHDHSMMEHRHAMMAEMKAEDDDLIALVAKMNSAPAVEKLDLVAAIVTHLVEQRAAMDARMEKMHGEMMKPMMHHKRMDKKSGHSTMNGTEKPSGDAQKEVK